MMKDEVTAGIVSQGERKNAFLLERRQIRSPGLTRYDPWGRVVARQVPGGWRYTRYTHGASYAAHPNLLRIDQWDAEDAASSRATDVTYLDALGREIAFIGHAGTVRESAWRGTELLSRVWIDDGAVFRQIDYDYESTTGRLSAIRGPYCPGDAAIDSTGYTYSPARRVLSHVAPEQKTTFTYDRGLTATEAWDDQIRTIVRGDPDAIWPTQIDLAGTGGGLRSRSFVRDGLGRITEETFTAPGAATVLTARSDFDAFGNPSTEVRSVGGGVESTTTWVYSALGRRTERTVQTLGDVATTSWTWRAGGTLAEVRTPSGQRSAYDYGATYDHVIDRVYDPTGTHPDYAVIVQRNRRGQILRLEQPADGTVRALAYDDAGRVVSRSSGPSGGIPVLGWAATYDGLGRLASETIYSNASGWTNEYAYDVRGRLAWERRGPTGEQRRYAWSKGGNLLSTEADAGGGYEPVMTATYAGQLLVNVDGSPIARDRGSDTTDHHGNVLAYTADSEVRTVSGPGATPVTIYRHADGLPVQKREGGAMTRRVVYGLDPAELPFEVRESDGDIATTVAGAGHTLGQIRNGKFLNADYMPAYACPSALPESMAM